MHHNDVVESLTTYYYEFISDQNHITLIYICLYILHNRHQKHDFHSQSHCKSALFAYFYKLITVKVIYVGIMIISHILIA